MKKYHVIFLIFISVFISCNTEKKHDSIPVVRKGVLDLRNWNFSQKGNLKISGDFEFYWKQLLEPKDFNTKDIKTKYFLSVPKYWNDSAGLSSDSYATYRLKVISKEHSHLSIFIDEEMSAYKFWCDTNLIYSCGTVSTTAEDYVPRRYPIIKEIELYKDTTELIFQLSNFSHRNGGFFTSPIIGLSDKVRIMRDRYVAIDIFLFGSILILGLYHIGIFMTRKGMYAALFFGLFSILLSIRTLLTGSRFFSTMFPSVSWEWQYRLEYFTTFFAPIMLAAFLYRLYSKDISLKITYAYFTVCLLLSLTVFFPPAVFTRVLPIFHLSVVLAIIYYPYRIFLIVKRKRYGSVILVLSFAFFIFTVILEMFFVIGGFSWAHELVSLGTFVLILGQSLVFARMFVQLFKDNDLLKSKLAVQNKELELTVVKRSEEIKQQQHDILIKNRELEHQNEEIRDKNNELEQQKELLTKSEAKIMSLVQLLPESIFEIDNQGNVIFANTEFFNNLGFNENDKLNIDELIICENKEDSFIKRIGEYMHKQTVIKELNLKIKRKDESILPILLSASLAPEVDDVAYRCSFMDITQRIADEQIMKYAYNEIEAKNKDITDSVRYASTIQRAVMPSTKLMKDIFNESFIINKPHSIVSGDFYYLNSRDNKIIFALSDCTGHGVPGGFMTMLGTTLLNQIYSDKYIVAPDVALDIIRNKIIHNLNQTNDANHISNQDGMDMVLFVFDTDTLMLEFASANQTVFICRNNEIITLKGDRMPVGIYAVMDKYTPQKIQLQKNDIIYSFSDGIVDIFGGKKGRRLYKKGLLKIILSCCDKPLEEQKEIIENTLTTWQGDNAQIDDMLMIAVKV